MKKDYFFIFLALALLAAIFGIKDLREEPRKKDLFSDAVRIDSPLPEQIIKGSVFFVTGAISKQEIDLFVDVKAKDSGELWATSKAEIQEKDGEKKFEAKVDTAGRGGLATLEFYDSGSPESRISFPIKISLSM
jgi:hypothetical protein